MSDPLYGEALIPFLLRGAKAVPVSRNPPPRQIMVGKIFQRPHESRPTLEYLLYQLARSFGLPAQKTKDVDKLSARRGTKTEHVVEEAIAVVAEAFELDTHARWDLEKNLERHLPLYLDLEASIWTIGADQRLVDWALANHFYVPVIARMMAFWYLDERNDVGMPDGRFWYLPEAKHGPDGPLTLPVANVVNWLLDLLGASPDGLVERRANALRDVEGDVDIDERGDLAQALYRWKSSQRLPKPETIDEYFSDGLEDTFGDALTLDRDLALDEQIAKILEFCSARRNKLTPKTLLGEIDMRASEAPLEARLMAVFEGTACVEEKQRFIYLMKRRYQAPDPQTVRQRLKLARASQDIYRRCEEYFSEGKARQLVELYKCVYNLTIAAEPSRCPHTIKSWGEAHEAFLESLGPLRYGVLSLFDNIEPPRRAPSFLKDRLLRVFMQSEEGSPLPDFFSPEATKRDVEWISQEIDIQNTLDWYAQALDRRKICSEVEALNDLWLLGRIMKDERVDVVIRQAASQRIDVLTRGTRLSAMGLTGRLEMARAADDEALINDMRQQVLNVQGDQAHAPHLLMQLGEHALAAEDFEGAQKYFMDALNIGKGGISGNMRGELSFHLWSLRRHLKKNANPGQERAWERDIAAFAFETDGVRGVPAQSEWYTIWSRECL